MNIRLYGIINDSIVDGEGLRLGVFVQGCPHHCPGCHNLGSHSIEEGTEFSTDAIIAMIDENSLLNGITLSGGEPFMQIEACETLARAAHKRGLSVWCYTGFTYEEIKAMDGASQLLNEIDVLVDGKFDEKQKSLDLLFKGSKNQRIIDIQKTQQNGEIVLYLE